jgi:phosphoribosylformylglycinamidine synthase subunit PurQ / glutaminase
VRVAVIPLPGTAPWRLPHEADAGLRVEPVAPDATELPAGLDAVLVGGPAHAGPAAGEVPKILVPIAAFAVAGGPVIGIGRGFQALCAASLLPGRLSPLAEPAGARAAVLRVEGRPTPFTGAIAAGRLLRLRDARLEWRYEHDDPTALEQAGQVVFRYVDEEGGVTGAADPSGSVRNIAGVCDPQGRVVGLAAHPVHPFAALFAAVDGVRLLDSLREHLADRMRPVAP